MKSLRFPICALTALGLAASLPSCSSKVRSSGTGGDGAGGTSGSSGASTMTAVTGETVGSSSSMGGAVGTSSSTGGTAGGAGESADGTGGTGGTGTGGTGDPPIMKCEEGDEFCECDDLGCFVAVGGPCSLDGDCKTQECGVTQMQDNVCCAQECEADQVCSVDGESCEIADPCSDGDYRCDGDYQECVDGQWMTVDECEGRGCDRAIGGCKLDVGDSCTSDAECGVGTCKDTATGSKVCCTSNCGQCQRCNDQGNGCATPATVPDGCDCTANDASKCEDSFSCTNDICVNNSCQNPVTTGCLINGACIPEGTPEPGNPCRRCISSMNSAGWSNAPNGTPCDDGLWCNGDNDVCDGLGTCSHTFPTGNRCAGATGACAVQVCNESRKNCFKAAGEICGQDTLEGCLQGSSCSADVYRWPVHYTCSGSSANCGTTPIEIQDEATVIDNCSSTEACHAATASCRPTLGCGNTYCKGGLCWMRSNAPMQYAQDPARGYCSNLELAGRSDWRLPTVAEFNTLVEGPVNGCYWPTEMGSCNDELWTTDDSSSFAFWVGTSALQTSSTPLYVRCVVTE